MRPKVFTIVKSPILSLLTLLCLAWASLAYAGPSTRVVIGDGAYQIGDRLFDDLDFEEVRERFSSVADRKFRMLAQKKNDAFNVEMVFENVVMQRGRWTDRDKFESALASFQERFPHILKSHIEETLSKYPHETIQKDGAQIITVNRGIEFWIDLVTHQDPERRAAAQIFLKRSFAEEYIGLPGNFVESIIGEFDRVTRILKADTFTEAEWRAITTLAQAQKYSISRHGNYVLLGTGQSFHLTNEVFIEAKRLSDPILQGRFVRVIEFLSTRGINIEIAEHQGAAAFFSPLENKIAYVMPSRGDLDSYTHEGTHARFQRFQGTLRKWAEKKGYAIPYQVDGPSIGLFADFGGYMNLLNELNSWRIGTSFSGPMTDREILKLLKDSYGRQAGKAAANAFGRLWPTSRVNNKSVPFLILEATKALNKMSDSEVLDYGREAVRSKDEIGQHNFLQLTFARFKAGEIPNEFLDMVLGLKDSGHTDAVKSVAKQISSHLTNDDGKSSRSTSEQRKAYDEFSNRADEWFKTLKNARVRVIPLDFTFDYKAVLFRAAQTNSKDYPTVIAELRAEFGNGKIYPSEDERSLFEDILRERGKTFEEKLARHLEEINGKGFEILWSEFIKKPDYDIQKLLAEHHSERFTARHIQRLFTVALDRRQNEYDQGKAIGLIEKVFEKLGFETIYETFEYPSMIRQQRSMNRSNGLPLDSYLPVLRSPNPSHWLFSPETDRLLAEKMFDGKPGVYRLDLINFITKFTYPEELPNLRSRIIDIITTDTTDINKYDFWVARMFLVPEKSFISKTHIAWGETVANAVLKDKTPNITALEFVAEFYRLAVSQSLPGRSSLLRTKDQLDENVRLEVRAASRKPSHRQKQLLRRAGIDLWRLLGHENDKVRRAARYAIATHPAFLLEVEDRILNALRAKDSKFRLEAIQLVSFTKPGFLPKVERYLESESFELRPGERDFLELRLTPEERMSKQVPKPTRAGGVSRCAELFLSMTSGPA